MFIDLIKKYRKKRKYTQKTIGMTLNLSRTSISNIESGRQELSLKYFLLLINLLEIEQKDLIKLYKKYDTNHVKRIKQKVKEQRKELSVQKELIKKEMLKLKQMKRKK